MDIKTKLIQAMMSGEDPAEALRKSLLQKTGLSGMETKLNSSIDSLTQMADLMLATKPEIPYSDIDSLLADYDQFEDIYRDYPDVKGVVSPLIKMIQLKDQLNL